MAKGGARLRDSWSAREREERRVMGTQRKREGGGCLLVDVVRY